MTMASVPSLCTTTAAVVAPLAISIRIGLTWNDPARACAAVSASKTASQGMLRRAVTIGFMRKGSQSCAAWWVTSEVYRRDDGISVRTHAHSLAGRYRTADAVRA